MEKEKKRLKRPICEECGKRYGATEQLSRVDDFITMRYECECGHKSKIYKGHIVK